MITEIEKLTLEIEQVALATPDDLEAYKRNYTGKKGAITQLFEGFKALPPDDKRAVGKPLNALKTRAEERLKEATEALSARASVARPQDLTLPGAPYNAGSRHPVRLTLQRIVGIFERLGYVVANGPEIEDDWHNFTALNFEANHPARDMQDTFFIDPETLLRTHTSPVQIRAMESQKPPIRILAPGRVYRNEVVTARSHCYFHQVEGLYIAKGVTYADLKLTLNYAAQQLFGPKTKIRLRPSYFPFTEISAEVDVSCFICNSAGCNVCKHTGWVEILGCGMVDPNVLENCKIDPDVYSGFAFGMGIERIAMLSYRIPDLRIFSQNDVRFLKQFS